jgi:predicted DNA binding protein
MSVIAELKVPANEFELGRILDIESGELIELETMVPVGQKAVPFFLVHEQIHDAFEEEVRKHPSVDRVREIDRHNGERLYKLDWDTSRDHFFSAIAETSAQLNSARGGAHEWQFELRFPSHDHLSRFHDLCENARIDLEVERIYNPTKPTVGPWYGLSQQQRETLTRAVTGGYYSIPRRLSTKDLAEEFGISDQAVTERLRRAIVTLTKNTLLTIPESTLETD